MQYPKGGYNVMDVGFGADQKQRANNRRDFDIPQVLAVHAVHDMMGETPNQPPPGP